MNPKLKKFARNLLIAATLGLGIAKHGSELFKPDLEQNTTLGELGEMLSASAGDWPVITEDQYEVWLSQIISEIFNIDVAGGNLEEFDLSSVTIRFALAEALSIEDGTTFSQFEFRVKRNPFPGAPNAFTITSHLGKVGENGSVDFYWYDPSQQNLQRFRHAAELIHNGLELGTPILLETQYRKPIEKYPGRQIVFNEYVNMQIPYPVEPLVSITIIEETNNITRHFPMGITTSGNPNGPTALGVTIDQNEPEYGHFFHGDDIDWLKPELDYVVSEIAGGYTSYVLQVETFGGEGYALPLD